MFAQKFFGFCSLVLCFSAATVACGAAPDQDSEGTASEEVKAAKDFYSCNVDKDCVAVPRVGCCSNGWKEAVNVHHKTAYSHSGPQVCNMMCPMFVVDDTRVAECNHATNKCEMVAIDEIVCGGFMADAHHCPANYDCVLKGNPDLPGSCEAASDDDAGTNDNGLSCATVDCQHGYHCEEKGINGGAVPVCLPN